MINKKIFKIEGMHCDSCAKIIEMELEGKVKNARIDSKTGIAEIEFDENKISENEIRKIIEKAGYKTK
ncbi:heavy-metal-associated domain-containing protein [Candidatus Pacearchaeota archaeon]|nr:heavy-metal-associated domain-containing protein [Candidatus Pacearchaeota archaeon]